MRWAMQMPRDTKSQKTGRQGAKIAAAWLERHDVIWRDGDAEADFGIDAEIELKLAGAELTGLLVKVQVKSSENPVFTRDGNSTVGVKAAHLNYWAALHLPVVALLVDTSLERLYWTLPPPIVGDSETKLVFTGDQCLNDDFVTFRQAMYQLARWPASTAVLDHVEHYVDVFTELQLVGEVDFGFAVDRDEFTALELFYDHLLRLRGLVGLTRPPLVPFAWWLDRSQYAEEVIGGDCDGYLFAWVAGELIDYLRPVYLETLIHVGEVARQESVITSHPRLAGYVAAGTLQRENLVARLDPSRTPPHTGSHGYRLALDHDSRQAQERFDQRLGRAGISRLTLSDVRRAAQLAGSSPPTGQPENDSQLSA
jgi:hypothetical protein